MIENVHTHVDVSPLTITEADEIFDGATDGVVLVSRTPVLGWCPARWVEGDVVAALVDAGADLAVIDDRYGHDYQLCDASEATHWVVWADDDDVPAALDTIRV